LVPGIDLKTSLAAIELSHKFDQVYASVGIHPNEAETWTNKSCEDIRVLCKSEKVVAVGEIGLDFYRSPGTSLLQEKILKDQLTIAQELQLPVLLHNRESSEKLIRNLKEFDVRGIFHAYDGDPILEEFGLSKGYFFGLGGSITYPKSRLSIKTLERIIPNGVTETDAPFLSPVPFRGKRNEPINVKTIGEFISKQTGLELSVLAMTLYDNANYLLKWK